MSNLKKVIIILAVILLIAIIALVAMLSMGNNTENVQVANQVDVPEQEKQASLTPVKSREDFYTIKESIGKYYSYYSILFNASTYYATEDEQVIAQAEKDNGQILYNMLDSTYITSKGITVDTLKANLTKIGQVTPYITGMYLVPNTGNLSTYVIEGKIKESVEDTGTNFEIIVKLDKSNKTFSIMPQEYIVEKYGTIIKEQNTDINTQTDFQADNMLIDQTILDEIIQNTPQAITPNANNTYTEPTITEETYVKDLFAEIRNELLNDSELAYSHLDEEYRTKKFATQEAFNSFVESKKAEYQTMKLAQYQIVEQNGYSQYVLVDQNGKYYIANETAVMQYTTMLDTYTVDLPQFIERYNSSNNAERAGLNLQKIVDALNNQDYSFIYSKLDETFKANNFSTEAEFASYVQRTFYNNNNVEFSNYQNSGELHIFDATFTDKTNESSNAITKTFIIKLLEGTDFVMSFNV